MCFFSSLSLAWGREKDRHDYDRHDSRYEKESRYSQNGVDRRPVGALDTEILERVKQRREEEEKREMERRQAAAKKLQALEEKIHSKRANVSEDSDNATSSSVTQGGVQKLDVGKERHASQYGSKEPYERRERYDKYERDRGGDRGGERDRNVDPRDRNYQSNLPPRFQRQQHGASDFKQQPERFERGSNASYRSERTSNNSNTGAKESSTAATTNVDTKNVPFAQQYDPRYIHQNMSKQLLQQKRRSDELLQPTGRRSNENRGRLDSDRDDYFPRKISVSSSDADKPSSVTGTSLLEKSSSRERITSWVDELESHEHDTKIDIYTEKQKQLMKSIDPHATADYEPKHILQRSKTSVSDDSSSNLNKSVGHAEDKTEAGDEKPEIKRSSESPKSWADHSANLDTSVEKGTDDNSSINKKDETDTDKKRPDKGSSEHKSSYKDMDDRRHGDKRGPRGGGRDSGGRRYDTRDTRDTRGGPQRSGGYGSYRGNNSNWNRRGGRGGHYRYGNMDYYSESEGSDYEDDYDRKDSRKGGKDMGSSGKGSAGQGREGFAPRGEPSRRGRGGSAGIQYNRRGGGMHGGSNSGNNKRIDNYGPPSSKSPFTGSDDQKDDYVDRERKVSEHSASDDKSKSKHLSKKGSDSHKASIKGDDDKGTDEHKRSHETKGDDRKDKSDPDSQDHGHRKIFGGGKREDGDRSYSSQYSRGTGSSQQSHRGSGKPQQKDDRSKPLSKPPGLSAKPRMKTNSTSSVGSNSERENSRPQPQRSSSNKDIQLQRGGNKSQSGAASSSNKSGGASSNHWDAKKVNIGQETPHQTEKSHDEGKEMF